MNKIHCNVDECSYNRDHLCLAEKVEVENCCEGSAKTSSETACKTFMPTRSCSVDGVVGVGYSD